MPSRMRPARRSLALHGGTLRRSALRCVPAVLLLAAGGCCAPATCRTAQTGFAALEPLTEAILAREASTGAPPAELTQVADQAPLLLATERGYAFHDARGELVPVYWNVIPGQEPTLHFKYMGANIGINACSWTPSRNAWRCGGYV